MITQAFRRVALTAVSVILAQAAAGSAFALPTKSKPAAPGGGSTAETADQKTIRDLAKSIIAHLPPAPPPGAACDAAARAAVKTAVESTIASANVTPTIAVGAIDLARAQPQHLDACRDGALADSATESSGSGEVVDEADTVRGFTLYSGPWPPTRPSATLVSSTPEPAPSAATPSPAGEAAAKPLPHTRRRHHRRHKIAVAGPKT